MRPRATAWRRGLVAGLWLGLAVACRGDGGGDDGLSGFGSGTVGADDGAATAGGDDGDGGDDGGQTGNDTGAASSSADDAATTADDGATTADDAATTADDAATTADAGDETGPPPDGDAALGECLGTGAWQTCAQWCAANDSACVEGGCGGSTVVYYGDVDECTAMRAGNGAAQACAADFAMGGGISFARCCCAT